MHRSGKGKDAGVAAGLGLAVLVTGMAAAANFGSNTSAYQEPAHPCDTTIYSQCIADTGAVTPRRS